MSLIDKLKALARPRSWKLRPEVLLCPNTPLPLHTVVPRTILGRKWWDATREAAYAATDYHCIACGIYKGDTPQRWLEGHEIYAVDYSKGRSVYVETVALCNKCHQFIHDGRMEALVDKGEMTKAAYDEVMRHGRRVLKDAGLKKKPYSGLFAEWENWRLVVNGEEYPPAFKDAASLNAFYDRKRKEKS